jgi:hypothetical protein
MRGQARRSPVLAQRAVADSPRWTRAVGDHLARPPREKIEERCADVRCVKDGWPIPIKYRERRK